MDEADISEITQENLLRQKILKIKNELNQKNKLVDLNEVFCEDCDIQIPPKRIEALPSATRCVSCQQEYEKG
jgi:phage/conjugal plasmid C-4 type zinc finger TraR family protein